MQSKYSRKARPAIHLIGASIAYIQLTRGQFSLVDKEDADFLAQWNWYAAFAPQTKTFYAKRAIPTGSSKPRQRELGMHNVIMKTPEGLQCDHKHRQTLHNIKAHLRNVTLRQNMTNSAETTSACGFRGVTFNKPKGKWQATIRIEGKRLFLGYFADPKVAGERYDEAAKLHHGEFRYR
jgi:hypothetical protein